MAEFGFKLYLETANLLEKLFITKKKRPNYISLDVFLIIG